MYIEGGGSALAVLYDATCNHSLKLIFLMILNAGEISSGKSSLLNFMIGTDVLPTSVLESRSVPCRLRYSPEKRANLIDASGNVIESVRFTENEEALNRLRTIIGGNQHIDGLSHIDIFLEESALQVSLGIFKS